MRGDTRRYGGDVPLLGGLAGVPLPLARTHLARTGHASLLHRALLRFAAHAAAARQGMRCGLYLATSTLTDARLRRHATERGRRVRAPRAWAAGMCFEQQAVVSANALLTNGSSLASTPFTYRAAPTSRRDRPSRRCLASRSLSSGITYGEIWGDMGRYGEVWGDMGRYGEI